MGKKPYKKKAPLPVTLDGLQAPQALDLEEVVLGAMMLEANLIDKVMADFSVSLFYKEANQLIAQAIIDLYKVESVIDILTVSQQLKNTKNLDAAGGPYYISQLTHRVASSANVEHHIRILQQEALKRNIIYICSNAVRKAFDGQEDAFDVYQDTQVELDSALKEILHYEVKKVGAIHEEILVESREIALKGIKSGVPSGLRMVDNLTNGWQKSDLIILAGRPSMGKTAAAVSMVMYPAIAQGLPVAIFSCEMSNHQLVSRMQSHLSEVNVSRIVKKQLSKDEIETIEKTCGYLERAPMYVDDTPNLSLMELKSKARRLVKEKGVTMIVIDYLQLMRSGMNIQNREQEIAEISRGLKALAKELNIPIIALSQLSRQVEGRGGDKKPQLSDLRESGQIEQDADMVIFCYRPEYYGIETYEVGSETFNSQGLFMFLIAKHRNGELGEIPLKFIGEQTKLTNHSFGMQPVTQENRTFVQESATSVQTGSMKLEENKSFLTEENDIHTSKDKDEPF